MSDGRFYRPGDPLPALIIPCATCSNTIGLKLEPCDFACRCGAEYAMFPGECEGHTGIVIILQRPTRATDRENGATCPKCANPIALDGFPGVALFVHNGVDVFATDVAGQLCRKCWTPLPAGIDPTLAPKWREMKNTVRAQQC